MGSLAESNGEIHKSASAANILHVATLAKVQPLILDIIIRHETATRRLCTAVGSGGIVTDVFNSVIDRYNIRPQRLIADSYDDRKVTSRADGSAAPDLKVRVRNEAIGALELFASRAVRQRIEVILRAR